MGGIEITNSTRMSQRINGRRKSNSVEKFLSKTKFRLKKIHPTKTIPSSLQDRDNVIQSLHIQLGLNTLSRVNETERPAAENNLALLKEDVERKQNAIQHLRGAIEKFDVTSNIDVRIRQAELECAVEREELKLMSMVEEVKALQGRTENPSSELTTLYSELQSGIILSLHAVHVNVGHWSVVENYDGSGLYIEWALDGENLYRGDRIIEVNGKVFSGTTREEFEHIIGKGEKCQLVVIRKRAISFGQQQLIQTQEHNLRLRQRISYLETHIRELRSNRSRKRCTKRNCNKISSPSDTTSNKNEFITNLLSMESGNFISSLKDQHCLKTNNNSSHGKIDKISSNLYINDVENEEKTLDCSKLINNSADKLNTSSNVAFQRTDRKRRTMTEKRHKFHNSTHRRSLRCIKYGLDKRKDYNSNQMAKTLCSVDISGNLAEFIPTAKKPPLPPKKPLRKSLLKTTNMEIIKQNNLKELGKTKSVAQDLENIENCPPMQHTPL